MYAIIKTGGKQYKVQPGQSVRVEKIEQALGSEFDLTEVLLVGGENPVIGQPTVKDAKVTVVVTKQAKDKKVLVFKKKRRQGYRKMRGHRQDFTELFVKSITVAGKTAKAQNEPIVVDVEKQREQKQLAKIAQKNEVRQSKELKEQKKIAKKVTKKVAKKKVAKKVTKKAAAKKVTKKATKKVAKKD